MMIPDGWQIRLPRLSYLPREEDRREQLARAWLTDTISVHARGRFDLESLRLVPSGYRGTVSDADLVVVHLRATGWLTLAERNRIRDAVSKILRDVLRSALPFVQIHPPESASP